MLRCLWQVGIRAPYRGEFWRSLGRTLWQAPHQLTWVVGHVVMGEHLLRYTREQVLPRLAQASAELSRERAATTTAAGPAQRSLRRHGPVCPVPVPPDPATCAAS